MSTRHPDITLSIRVVIIAFKVLCGTKWIEISSKLALHPDSGRSFFKRTQELAKGSNNFWQLLKYIKPSPCGHSPQIVVPGSEESHEVCRQVLDHCT
jgi:hypothetical protein